MPRPALRAAARTWAEQIQNIQFKILKPRALMVGFNPKLEIQNWLNLCPVDYRSIKLIV